MMTSRTIISMPSPPSVAGTKRRAPISEDDDAPRKAIKTSANSTPGRSWRPEQYRPCAIAAAASSNFAMDQMDQDVNAPLSTVATPSTPSSAARLPPHSLLELPSEVRNLIYDFACPEEATLLESVSTPSRPRKWESYNKNCSVRNEARQFKNFTLVCKQIREDFLPMYLRTVPGNPIRFYDIPRYLEKAYPEYDGTLESLANSMCWGDVEIVANTARDSDNIDITPLLHIGAQFPQFKLRFECPYGNASKFDAVDEINRSLKQHWETWKTLARVEDLKVQVHTFLGRIKVIVGDDFFEDLVWPGTEEDVNSTNLLKRMGLPRFDHGNGWSVSTVWNSDDDAESDLTDRLHRRFVGEFRGRRVVID